MEGLARIPAPKEMLDYVQRLLWTSGELGRAVCRRGWAKPDVWALAPASKAAAADATQRKHSANAWVDEWLMAQSKQAFRFCLAAQDLLAPPFDSEAAAPAALGRWDVRGEESYFVVSKEELAPGAVDAATGWMISDEFILYVIEDDWPFDASRPLQDMADKVRHVIVAVSEDESYGIVSGM